jgi:Fic family protein
MYDSPHQFEPLLLSTAQNEALLPKARAIIAASLQLTHAAHPATLTALRELVRSMNSYYSNRIEGQSTHPRNIERALRHDFSSRPEVARLQRIALAHIEAERELETLDMAPSSSAFLQRAHQALYERLAPMDRLSDEGLTVEPGQLRSHNVDVGKHVAPLASALPAFLSRLDQVYEPGTGWEQRLIAIALLHHRVAWVHPFLDGNGRATRLQSHAALWPLSAGLWSPSRGLARDRQAYYAALANADAPRRGDLDGRGNLSGQGLFDWVQYFLAVCEDQVTFMGRMLDLDGMRQRLLALITFLGAEDKAIRAEAVLPLHHVFAAGPVTRGEFSQMTGLGERTARNLLSALLQRGLLASDTPLGRVHFGLPLDALGLLLPNLYPEAASPL